MNELRVREIHYFIIQVIFFSFNFVANTRTVCVHNDIVCVHECETAILYVNCRKSKLPTRKKKRQINKEKCNNNKTDSQHESYIALHEKKERERERRTVSSTRRQRLSERKREKWWKHHTKYTWPNNKYMLLLLLLLLRLLHTISHNKHDHSSEYIENKLYKQFVCTCSVMTMIETKPENVQTIVRPR